MENQVCDQVRCPICFEIPKSEIYQCVDGHTICSECLSNVTDCPQCRHPFGNLKIRNRALESIRDSIPSKCSHEEFGCVLLLPKNELAHHEETCIFKPEFMDVCKTMGYNCGFKTNMKTIQKSLIPHFEQVHGAIKRQNSQICLYYNDFIASTDPTNIGNTLWTPILIYNGNNENDGCFLLSCAVCNLDNTVTWSCLQLNDEDNFYVKFCIKSVCGKVKPLTWSIPCVNIHEAIDTQFVESRTFRVSTLLLNRYYTNERNLELHVEICKLVVNSDISNDVEPTWIFCGPSVINEVSAGHGITQPADNSYNPTELVMSNNFTIKFSGFVCEEVLEEDSGGVIPQNTPPPFSRLSGARPRMSQSQRHPFFPPPPPTRTTPPLDLGVILGLDRVAPFRPSRVPTQRENFRRVPIPPSFPTANVQNSIHWAMPAAPRFRVPNFRYPPNHPPPPPPKRDRDPSQPPSPPPRPSATLR